MQRSICAALLSMTLAGCGSEAPAPAPTPPPAAPVAPIVQVAPADLYVLAVGGTGLRPEMDLAALRQRYGEAEVITQPVDLGEGQTEAGAVIHPNDPARRAYVYFVDGDTTKTVSALYVRDVGSTWTGPFGIRIGTPSTELERLNGKPFRFLGFDWDYGGYVSHWTEGSLAKAFLPPGQLSVRLQPPELTDGESMPEGYPAGDGEFASDASAVREKPPLVGEFGLSFVRAP